MNLSAILLSLAMMTVSCSSAVAPRFQFKLLPYYSFSERAHATNTTYITDTWLAPNVYIKNNDLPTFKEFLRVHLDSLVNLSMPAFLQEEGVRSELEDVLMGIIDRIDEVVTRHRDSVIEQLLESKERPTIEIFCKILDRHLKTISIITKEMRDPFSVDYLLMILIIYSFPPVRVWLLHNEIRDDYGPPPILTIEESSFQNLFEYFERIMNHQTICSELLTGQWSIRGPFGINPKFRMVMKSSAEYLQASCLIASVIDVDMIKKFDESIHKMAEIEEVLAHIPPVSTCSQQFTIMVFEQDSEAEHEWLMARIECPQRLRNGNYYVSVLQLFAELKFVYHQPVQFKVKSGPIDTTNCGINPESIMSNLPTDLIAVILDKTKRNLYNPAALVCKHFYQLLTLSPDLTSPPSFIPLSVNNIANFIQMALLSRDKQGLHFDSAFLSRLSLFVCESLPYVDTVQVLMKLKTMCIKEDHYSKAILKMMEEAITFTEYFECDEDDF
jgi:hypothetical protein